MEFSDIIEQVKGAGSKPIKVLRPPEDDDNNDIILEESITSFLSCTKAFDVPVVFIYAGKFDEDEFKYESESYIYGEDEYIDLDKIEPKLKAYRKHIGEHCFFELTAPIGVRMVRAMIPVEWWDEFNILKEKVVQKIEEREEQYFHKIETENEIEAEKQRALVNSLLEKLQALTKNKDFCKFASKTKQTQRAILTFAVELMPGLRQIDEKILKTKIAELADTIRIRKEFKNKT